jgi:hypothetical protein
MNTDKKPLIRNRYVTLEIFRKSGIHQKTNKAIRKKQNQVMSKYQFERE